MKAKSKLLEAFKYLEELYKVKKGEFERLSKLWRFYQNKLKQVEKLTGNVKEKEEERVKRSLNFVKQRIKRIDDDLSKITRVGEFQEGKSKVYSIEVFIGGTPYVLIVRFLENEVEIALTDSKGIPIEYLEIDLNTGKMMYKNLEKAGE